MKRVTVELGVKLPQGYAVILTDDDAFQVTEEGRVLVRETRGTWRDIGEVTHSALETIMELPDREPWARGRET